MEFLGLTIARTRTLRETLSPVPSGAASRGSGGWIPVVREPYTGAWQQNVQISQETALSYYAVFACVTLISADIGKLRLRLVSQDAAGIWTETTNPAYSPVLRKPNRYQTMGKFVEQWMTSKLVHGNTFVLKERDQRGVVKALYILDPTRVTPLLATDGSIYYQLQRDDLTGVGLTDVTVPASEIIHDLMVALFHPLVGVTPLYACGISAQQGLTIQSSSNLFFATGSRPGGTLIAPGAISDENAARLKAYWETNFSGQNVGKVAVLGDGLKYEPMTISAVDAQLIDQLKWTAETICSAYHVPPYMVQIGPPPPYANVEPLVQQYYSQCLQSLITALEVSLDEGLELITPYGTEFDIDDLIWMDTATRTKAAHEAISAGALSPNEARKKYFAVGPMPGGESPYLQQQYYSLEALAARDAAPPSGPAAPPPPAPVPPESDQVLATLTAIRTAAFREGLYVA
jgi:HK97 family phage portal protein